MALSSKHRKYHELSPCDVFTKEETPITSYDVGRATSATGEQFHFSCPVYKSDTREELNNRIQFLMSIVQDRLEEENEAMQEAEAEVTKARRKGEVMKRNRSKYDAELKALKKEAKKKGWTEEETTTKVTELTNKFEKAQELVAGAEDLETIMDLSKKPLEAVEATATH